MKRDFEELLHAMTLTTKILPGLERMRKLDHALGCPSKKFASIHIAGTNAKGTISLKIAESLFQSKKKVGLYTSPHFFSFRERIQIDGVLIEKNEAEELLEEIVKQASFLELELSFFEALTQLAFCYFAIHQVDYAVIETGLGGRLDATNILESKISVITSIGRDHEDLLGNSIQKISREKAGIIKKNQPVILGPRINPKPFLEVAKKNHANLIQPPKQKSLELDNEIVAKTALDYLNLDFVPKVRAFGRFEILQKNPLVIADVAHNRPALHCFLKKINVKKPLFCVVAFSTEKRATDLLDLLKNRAEKIFLTEPLHERIISIDGVASHPKIFHEKSVKKAVALAMEQAKLFDGMVVILGSFFLMPEALALFGIEKVPGHWGSRCERKSFSNPWED